MNEIVKMFENAGIELMKKYECRCGTSSTKQTKETCPSKICGKAVCDQIENGIFSPIFPSKNQLKLLELIAKLDIVDYFGICHKPLNMPHFLFQAVGITEFSHEQPPLYNIEANCIADGIAGLINRLWAELTPEDRKEIKRILEDV